MYRGKPSSMEKVRLSLTKYDPKPSVNVTCWVNLFDLMLLAKDISDGRKIQQVQFYSGTKNDSYDTGFEARGLVAGFWAEGDNKKGAYTIEVTNGPGTQTDTGAVMPKKGSDTKSVRIVLTVPEARTAMLYVRDYFNSKRAAFLARHDIKYPGEDS